MRKHSGKLLIRFIIVAIVVVIAVSAILTIISSVMISNTYKSMTKEELVATCEHIRSQLESTWDGDWSYEDDVLRKGDEAVSEEYTDLIDELRRDTGIDYTLFYGDTRILTTILRGNTNDRLIGTKASEAVIQATLNGGNPYYSDSLNIEGKPYYGYYLPIKNSDGTIIGMMFTGRESSDIKSTILKSIIQMMILTLILTIVISIASILFALKVSKEMDAVSEFIKKLSEGYLNIDISESIISRNDELGAIAENTKILSDSLKSTVLDIKEVANTINETSKGVSETANQISQTAEDVSNAVQEIASGATQQADEIQSASMNVVQIGDAVQSVKDSSDNLTTLSQKMKSASESSTKALSELRDSANDMTDKIDDISSAITETQNAVSNINEKVEGITAIATQTNLLSLNASIEAARAGEAGRGFNVVAEEIGKLAEDSKKMADDIKAEMEILLEKADSAVTSAKIVKDANIEQQTSLGDTIESINGMLTDIDVTVNGVSEISSGAEQCETSKNAVTDVISALSAISEENAASSEETGASMEELSATVTTLAESANGLKDVAAKLNDEMTFFKI